MSLSAGNSLEKRGIEELFEALMENTTLSELVLYGLE